jgi:hypothetical protein
MRRAVVVACLLAAWAFAQSGFYQLHIDQDQLSGAADFSFLNRPLQPADRLFVRDGHFTRVGEDLTPLTADDERIRLFGLNFCFGANFPSETDAVRIAQRLRRLGVNLVRLHHMDSQPDSNPANAGSLLTTGPYPTLNPVAVSRLRALLDAFEAEGIYINLNLHVGYQFRPSVDQVPVLAVFPTQSKPLHVFYPRMVDLQREYTRKVIEALRLKDDPVLAMVEIDNECSLVREWQASNLDRYLQAEYKDEFQRQWNKFLSAAYLTTDALQKAWGAYQADGPELLSGNWTIENHAPGRGTTPEAAPGESPPATRVQVLDGSDVVILKQVGFSVTTEQHYTAEVEVRADLPAGATRTIYWDIKQNISPWRTAVSSTITVGGEWQKYQMGFQPSFAMEGIGRFGMSIEKLVGTTVYVRNAGLRVTGARGLAPGESLEAGNVALVGENEYATEVRANDYLAFLADRDRAYLRVMLEAVRQSTDRWAPVAGTQVGYGGLLNFDSHQDLDYDDNHFYVDHYNFPNVSWDGRDWRIRDSSSLGGGLNEFLNMAIARQRGRPYTVSEYNLPWPNRQAAEIDPTLAAFGAFQDWDSIMHFAYSHGRGWDDGVPNGFNINGDWTKWVNLGQSAWLFRWAVVRPAMEAIDIPVSKELRLRAGREKRNSAINAFLGATVGYNTANAFIHSVRLVKDGEGPVPEAARAAPASPFRADTGELTYDRNARLFLIHAERAAGVFGFAGQSKVAAGAIDVELAPGARGFAAILLTSLDGQPLAESGRMLLSNPGHTLRTQPGSDPQRPQALINYGTTKDWWTIEPEPNYASKPSGNLNGGQRPVWMERVECFVTLRTSAAALTVYPLDGAGRRLKPLAESDVERVEGGFRVHLQAEGQSFSPWYELVRP